MTFLHTAMKSVARRRHMVLARHRGHPNGEIHIVDENRSESTKEEEKQYQGHRQEWWNATDIVPAELTNEKPWFSLCGEKFPPGTVEPVQWGTIWPHRGCTGKADVPLSLIVREYRSAHDMRLSQNASPEEKDAAVALLEPVFADRGGGWTVDTGDGAAYWTFESSFDGILPGGRLRPRGIDIGLERLWVEIPYPGTVHIHSCGVRDGCPQHVIHTETFPLSHIGALTERISAHERAATSIALDKLAWCLFAGDCAATYEYGD